MRILTCYLLDDFSTIDTELTIEYLLSCQTYEGGFGFITGAEAHGRKSSYFACGFCWDRIKNMWYG